MGRACIDESNSAVRRNSRLRRLRQTGRTARSQKSTGDSNRPHAEETRLFERPVSPYRTGRTDKVPGSNGEPQKSSLAVAAAARSWSTVCALAVGTSFCCAAAGTAAAAIARQNARPRRGESGRRRPVRSNSGRGRAAESMRPVRPAIGSSASRKWRIRVCCRARRQYLQVTAPPVTWARCQRPTGGAWRS